MNMTGPHAHVNNQHVYFLGLLAVFHRSSLLFHGAVSPYDSHPCWPPAAMKPHADIPLKKAVAGVRVGYLPGQGFVVNPTASQMAASQLDLMMAGTAEAVLMIEGFCDWLSEEQMLEVKEVAWWPGLVANLLLAW